MPSQFHITIDLVKNDAYISNQILKALAEDFNLAVASKLNNIKIKIANATILLLSSTSTYQSLISGELAAHFGLPSSNRKSMVDAIIRKIANSIEVVYQPVKVRSQKFVNGMTISVLIKDFSDILYMAEAFVTTEKGAPLPWLDWLLLKGDKVLISEHEIHLIGGKGRSGSAIMVKNSASSWRVPPAYSGTTTDNWLTQAFLVDPAQYLNILTTILENELA